MADNFRTTEVRTLRSTDTSDVHVPHVTLDTKLAGEDQTLDVMKTVENNGTYSAARSTADVSIGATGAAGDRLRAVVVTVAPTVAALTISDGAGTVVCSIPTTATVGQTIDCFNAIAATSGFVIDLHATGVGTVTAFGTFT